MTEKTLDYQPVEPPDPKRRRNAWAFGCVVLFMLFPTLLLFAFVILALIFSHH